MVQLKRLACEQAPDWVMEVELAECGIGRGLRAKNGPNFFSLVGSLCSQHFSPSLRACPGEWGWGEACCL